MVSRLNLEKIYQNLLIILGFLLPITVAGANLIIGVIIILWLISGNYKVKFNEIINNRFLVASIIFFAIHVFGLIWSNDLNWGLEIVRKMWYFFLLLPILCSIVSYENIDRYIASFLYAILISVLLSYLVFFGVIDEFKNATQTNPTPFTSHISYNPMLAFGIYLLTRRFLFNKNHTRIKFFFYFLLILLMSINMFITGGRSGQIMYFSIVFVLFFQFYKTNIVKAILLSILSVSSIFYTAYELNSNFQTKVDSSIESIMNYSENKHTSTGLRITFAINSLEMIKPNFLLGVGTGDFPSEYKKINDKNSPNLVETTNPHNMYILILAQHGLIGLVSFLSIFYFQFKYAFISSSKLYRDIGFTLPFLYLIIMFGESYLLGHFTTLMYIFFSSFLYKNFENS